MTVKKVKKILGLLAVLGLTAALAACGAKAPAKGPQKPRKLIIDTDTGADDASALILAAKSSGIEILGVTTLAGNVDLEQSTRNALMALEIAGCGAPEVMRQVRRIWSMGTAGLGPGNASPVAEFNVYGDAEAYRVMLESGIPVTIVGLDMCGGAAMWTSKQFDTLRGTNAAGRFVADSFGKLRAFYAANGSEDAAMNCDALAMMCVVRPDFVKETVQTYASCITDAGETYAQVIFYKEGFTYDVVANDFDHNVTLVTDVDRDRYFSFYRDAIRG